jgi:hypothetical protein
MTTTSQPTSASNPDGPRARRWRTIEQIAQAYPFTVPAIRALIQRSRPHFNSRGDWVEGNGLADAVSQPGGKNGKVLIDEIGFAKWLERWVTDPKNDREAA